MTLTAYQVYSKHTERANLAVSRSSIIPQQCVYSTALSGEAGYFYGGVFEQRLLCEQQRSSCVATDVAGRRRRTMRG